MLDKSQYTAIMAMLWAIYAQICFMQDGTLALIMGIASFIIMVAWMAAYIYNELKGIRKH